jgi:hypothetical protein
MSEFASGNALSGGCLHNETILQNQGNAAVQGGRKQEAEAVGQPAQQLTPALIRDTLCWQSAQYPFQQW